MTKANQLQSAAGGQLTVAAAYGSWKLEKLTGKTIILGTLDLSDMTIEKPETVAARICRALPHVAPQHVVVAPDCGLKYLPREVAYGKICAMVEGARIVRRELSASVTPENLA